MENNSKTSGGLGVLAVVQIVFIILKLCGVINWSWLVVLVLFWIELAAIIVGAIVLFAINKHLDKYNPKKK